MSSWMIILLIVIAILFIAGPIFMLQGDGKFRIPKNFKNTQGYDQDEEDWPKKDSKTDKNQ